MAFCQAQRKKLIEQVLGESTSVHDTSLLKGALHWCPDYEFCKSSTLAPDFTHYGDFGMLAQALASKGFEIDITFCPGTHEWEVVLAKPGESAPGRITCHPSLPIALATAALMTLEGKK
jgi:hypothetical protein